MRPFRLAALALAFASPLAAQEAVHTDTARSASEERPPRYAYGTAAGALSFPDGHSQEAFSVVLQYQPAPWVVFSAAPAMARATDTTGTSARSGLTDMPVAVGVTRAFAHAAWRPSVGLSTIASLPVGDSNVGLGSGTTELSADAALGVAPRDGLDLRLSASRGLSSGASAGMGLAGTSLGAEAAYDVGARTNVNALYSAEVGSVDSTYTLSRVFGAGMSYAVAGPVTLTLEGIHTLSGDGPRWGMTIGFGTAFAGISPVGATSPLSRLKGAFGARQSKKGTSLIGTGGTCHATRTC